ncbi:TetR/AcrR family transcriptional regulator [Kitasatospora sp. NBC_01266]|uniref:TetR/AcrR family transcriptional regulator n=1 Tax=Kitasatospora sp. NBC_01266 TaxID=2903572 RepID=UPI002E36D5AD|nr:TetR/AcrR family transcriptional regulator [Kitasatospora sp. NBC_01266]
MTGRPRDPAVDEAIRHAAIQLVKEQGYRGLSMEGIAARSGVSKQTVYRRFRSKGEVVLEAMVGFAAVKLPTPDTGSLRGDLAELLTATFRSVQGVAGTLNRALATEAMQDEEFAQRVWQELISSRRGAVGELLARGRARGEVGHPDDEFLLDLIYAPLWYWLLFRVDRLTDAYAAQLTEAVCKAAA